MCTIAVKYLDDFGWVGVKNRDRNYRCDIEVIQSNRDGAQRLYIDDQLSRWSEGINEYGVSIISASFSVKSDEKEGDKIILKRKNKRNQIGYYSPDGKTMRKALLEKTPKAALKVLIDRNLAGATYVFNQDTCYILEGGFTVKKKDSTKDQPREYIYKTKKLKKGYSCRTNHGLMLPQLGYHANPTDERLIRARKSSEKRLEYAFKFIGADLKEPGELIDALAQSPDRDLFMNPIRVGNTKKNDMVTTGQLMIVPKEQTLHYRPIYSSVKFDYNRLSGPESKTFFEIISSRKLLSFKEHKKVQAEQIKTIKVGEDAVGTDAKLHYAVVSDRKVQAVGEKEEMLDYCKENGGRVWKTAKQVGDLVEEKS